MIQIINGFKINSEHPVDSRIVVRDEATRLAILYKYHGLRVWQTDTNTPYFWDGTDWKSELDLVVTSDGDVTEGSVPVFTKSNPVKIGDSIISVVGGEVIINGDLSFDSITSGSINANLIDTGTMSVSRLQKGSDGQILSTNNSGLIEWTNLSGLTIGKSTNSTNSDKLKIKPITVSDTYQLVLRNVNSNISVGGDYMELYSHTNGLKFKNDGGNGLRILAHNGSSSNPPYSFHSATEDSTNTYNTGMYRPDENKIGFSINGNRRLWIEDTYIGFGDLNNGSPTVRTNNNTSPATPSYSWFGNPNTGMYRPANNEIGFSTSGTERVRIDNSGLKTIFGTVGSPSYSWIGNTNTGMYRPSPDVIGFSIAGNLMGFFESDGLRIKDKNGSPSGYINVSYIGVPIGGIIMWSGNINNIGNGHLWNFRLCDGQTIPGSVINPDDGTALTPKYTSQNVPDLRERFVVGAGDNPTVDGYGYSVGAIGGSNFVTLNPGQVPLRDHAHGPGDLNITSSGGHTHQIPSNDAQGNGAILRDGKTSGGGYPGGVASESATHSHPIGSFSGNTGYAGIETGIGGHENRPPYYAVAFIIRIV